MALNKVYIYIGLISLLIFALLSLQYKQSANSIQNYLLDVYSNSPLGIYLNAAVSTDASECAPVGLAILKQGGNAVDAAISTLLCMGLVLPHSMGLGGGSYLLYYDRKTQKAAAYDGRETAPRHVLNTNYSLNKENLQIGQYSIAVPGELALYVDVHRNHGRLKWKKLFDIPIEMALKGVRINHHLASNIEKSKKLILNSKLKNLFTNKITNNFLKEGDILVRKDLAQTYKMLANSDDPKKLFYDGELTDIFIKELDKLNITDEFKQYKVRSGPAHVFNLNEEKKLFVTSIPSSGIIFGFIMKVFDHFKHKVLLNKIDFSLDKVSAFYHLLIEILKHAYSRRTMLGDSIEELHTLVHNLTSFDETSNTSYFKDVLSKLDMQQTHPTSYYGGDSELILDHGTAHLSIVDQEGNSVSVTSTINIYFGSTILSSTGILFNDEIDDFSVPNINNFFDFPPSKNNILAPFKRPVSSMCPIILINSNGDVHASLGAAGGSHIISGMAQILVRILYFNETIKEAIDQPKLHHQLYPNKLFFENGFNQEVLDTLNNKYNHEIEEMKNRKSVVTGIVRTWNGSYSANTDYRKGGSIDGF